jgi:protein TonB
LQEQQRLLAQIRRGGTLPHDRAKRHAATSGKKTRQLLKLMAEIEKRINEESARPRKRYISPATREEAYALYYDKLRRRVEERGTRNFPEHQGRKLYGELTMNVTIEARGRVVEADRVRRVAGARSRASPSCRVAVRPFTTAMRRRPTRSW